MAPAPLVASSLLGVTAVLSMLGLALDADPFSAQSALMIAIGLGLLTLATVSGVLLARGRWSRWMALGVAALWFAQSVARPLDGLNGAAIATAVAAASIAAGPWLPRWLRRLPAADAPPPAAVALMLLLISTPALVGLASAGDTPGLVGWALVIWSELLAFGLARAVTPALWAGRFGHVPVSIAAGFLLGLPAGVAVLTKASLEAVLLWRRDLQLAVSPLLRTSGAVTAIPPELMDPTIMKTAGLDNRGRPLED